MESAVGFYANKPLVVCCRHVLGRAWQSKNKTQHKKEETPRRWACGGGGSCLYHVSLLHFAKMWLACNAAIYYLWWWIAQALSPVRSRWRQLSARWRWAPRGGCQVRASGWQRPALDEWGGDCGQRRSPQCLVDGQSAAGAHAKPLGLEGRRSSMQGWREQKERKAN